MDPAQPRAQMAGQASRDNRDTLTRKDRKSPDAIQVDKHNMAMEIQQTTLPFEKGKKKRRPTKANDKVLKLKVMSVHATKNIKHHKSNHSDKTQEDDNLKDSHTVCKKRNKQDKRSMEDDEPVPEYLLGPKRRRKRAKPFRKDEVEEMVRFVDEHSYGIAQRGQIHAQKSKIMHHLSIHLYHKFGTLHTKKQCQKRLSDLKVRQRKTLEAIRSKISKGVPKQPVKSPELTQKNRNHEQQEIVDPENILTPPLITEDTVTLTLHPIETPSQDNVPPANIHEEYIEKLKLHIDTILTTKFTQLEERMCARFQRHSQKIISHIGNLRKEFGHKYSKRPNK